MRRDSHLAEKETICMEDLWDKPLIGSHQKGENRYLGRWLQQKESELHIVAASILYGIFQSSILMAESNISAIPGASILNDVDNMTKVVQAYEKSLRTISIGSCAPGPTFKLYPLLTENFPGMTISSEIRESDILLPELEKNAYQIIITEHPIEAPDIICREFCRENLFLMVPPAHPLAHNRDGILLEDLAGETMLLYHEIGVWRKLTETKMSQTKFILQDRDEAFNALMQASALPAFATNLTLEYTNRPNNRLAIPVLDPEAQITFYCSVHKSNKSFLP